MNIKNLYIAYTFQRDAYEWLNKKEMIYKHDLDNVVTIEFLNKSGEYYIQRWRYKNGNIHSETPYKNGLIHGLKKLYYKNGNIHCETPYKNGKIHGLEKWYWSNGIICIETPFENGKQHGLEKSYYKNGSLNAVYG